MNRPFWFDLVYLFWKPCLAMAVVEIAALMIRLPGFVFGASAVTFATVFFASVYVRPGEKK
ncbi:MAG: hypothetical protein H7Y38_17680 [Armatimonadetes bacterium]|nr:hypothetical protein [Armatimonadota bacterium]